MTDDFKNTVEWIANQLIHNVPATEVPGEVITMPVRGMDDEPQMWSANMTTYTLGIMLKGALLTEQD